MSLQGIQVPFQSIDRALQSLFFGASIHVQSIEGWTVCMESVAIPLNDSENLDLHALFSLPYACMRRLRPDGLILTGSLPRHATRTFVLGLVYAAVGPASSYETGWQLKPPLSAEEPATT